MARKRAFSTGRPESVGGGVVLADGAQDEAGTGSVEVKRDRDRQQDGAVDEEVLRKEQAADDR